MGNVVKRHDIGAFKYRLYCTLITGSQLLTFLPSRNSSWMWWRRYVWRGGHTWWGGGLCGEGVAYLVKGGCVRWGMCVTKGGMHGKGGIHGRGCMWQRGYAWLVCVAGETATAADGMHPTGMHSCLWIYTVSKTQKRYFAICSDTLDSAASINQYVLNVIRFECKEYR